MTVLSSTIIIIIIIVIVLIYFLLVKAFYQAIPAGRLSFSVSHCRRSFLKFTL